ncbi:MAG: hypothetical protein ABI797_03035 [Chloroflexota bacterium]
MIIFGLLTPVTFLGSKVDQCTHCRQVGSHYLVRKTYWVHIFWVPAVLVGFRHGMVCWECGTWTGIPFLTMRWAMRTGTLPLTRARPDADALRQQIFDDTYRKPSEAELFDGVAVNPKRGAFDLYFKVWPLLVLGVVVLLLVNSLGR